MKRITAVILLIFLIIPFVCACKSQNNETITPNINDKDSNEKEEETVQKIYIDYEAKQKIGLYDIKDKLLVNGRCSFTEEKGLQCYWSNSGFEIGGWFKGQFKIYFSLDLTKTPVNFCIVVDGEQENPKYVTLNENLSAITLPNLPRGYHTIAIYKVDEGSRNHAYFNAIEFYGKLDDEPLEKSLKIETIGDSISAGLGIKSPQGLDDDAFCSYTAKIARNLNAQSSVLAIGGWGLSCGVTNYDKVMPKIFDFVCSVQGNRNEWDFENNQVDVVILNLGTNDWLQYHDKDRTELHKAANAFLDKLRSVYPDAMIYWTYGMMNTDFVEDFKNIIANKNDEKIKFVDVFVNSSGLGGHPDNYAHQEYAKIIEKVIREDLNYEEGILDIQKTIREKNKLVTTIKPKEE